MSTTGNGGQSQPGPVGARPQAESIPTQGGQAQQVKGEATSAAEEASPIADLAEAGAHMRMLIDREPLTRRTLALFAGVGVLAVTFSALVFAIQDDAVTRGSALVAGLSALGGIAYAAYEIRNDQGYTEDVATMGMVLLGLQADQDNPYAPYLREKHLALVRHAIQILNARGAYQQAEEIDVQLVALQAVWQRIRRAST